MALSSNIWKLYIYRALSALEFMLPIFVIFLLDNNLSLTQILILQAAYAVALLVLEIPTGAFADRYGRKKSIIISSIIVFAACIIYASGRSFTGFFMAEILWAVGASFWSGADTAFLYDTLKDMKRENEFKKICGTLNSIESIFFGVGGLIGGFLVIYGLRFPFYMTLIPLGIAMIIPFTLKEPQLFQKVKYRYWTHIKDAIKHTAKHTRLRFIIAYSAILAVTTEVVFFLYQPYLQSINIPLTLFGIIFAVFSAIFALGSKLAHRIEPRLGEKTTLLGIMLVSAAAIFMISRTAAFYVIIFFMVFEFTCGLARPVLLSYLHHHIESYRRATIISLNNMSRSLSIAIIAPLFGAIADYWSLQTAFMIIAIMLAVYFAILAAVFLIFRK